MNKPLLKTLCCFIVFLQFAGCASMPKPTPPVVIYDSEPSSIATVLPDTVSYNGFRQKIAELKGKIKYNNDGKQEYLSLYNKVEELDSVQIGHEGRNIKIRNRATTIGAIVPLVVGVSFAVWGFSEANEPGCSEANAIIGAASYAVLLITPLATGLGALIGLFGSGIIMGDDVKKEHKATLAGLVDDYNLLNKSTIAPVVSDSTNKQ
ncbi:MAG: hypothetical protein KJ620_00210 [Candidatus Edwardsbacteria bacterium]|nr:hypothetical protein [Candidatus Edwardsbacteria bacterium]MBU1576084.1 hypothetical protein [Candidatus Edwardsbacteria bacterium]MBU2462740.1 hypothetical protein [Candidatus Edwardsbacteria bacterium]MBU2593225.1 hypothetical protein [Candidatus Edwardsbacteria bacterium]